ncbi:MAG: 50S ribosomal protein L11 methyltransferase [Deltaproteobacteria bacterium]|nr:50S ribosomal protein L11 methyltransferase [Deltaproteobacteria bacterium]
MGPWHSAIVTLPRGVDDVTLDVLSSALFDAGSSGIETKDQQQPVVLIAAFSPDITPETILERVHSAIAATGLEGAGVEIRQEDAVDWSTHWREHFKPLDFGPLWVVPTWLEAPAGARAVLRMDPGMAFGTGSHETTALCLERIAELSPIASLLDVGTGTGILALSALLLGAKRAVGTDNDPDALAVATENAALNGLADRLELSGRTPDSLGDRFSVVVANILAEPLITLAPKISAAVASGGHLILSGILAPQAAAVAEAYEALGFRERRIVIRGEWARIDLRAP